MFTLYLFTMIVCTGLRVSGTEDSKEETWTDSHKFQGDIDGYDQAEFDELITDLNQWQNRRQQNKNGSTAVFQSAISDPRGLWLNGIVPYIIQSTDAKLREAVLGAIKDFHRFTCIKFVERTTEENYVKFMDRGPGCYSSLGNRRKGGQVLNLGQGCKTKGTAAHEMMHALGFWHEQQRPDRDNHIVVLTENIDPNNKDQYKIANTSVVNLIGRYDMDSIMHYPSDSFALPGKRTMRAKDSKRHNFGGEQLTDEDKRKVRQLYRCDDDDNDNQTQITIEPGVTYYVKADGTENCWDVPGASTENGEQLQQWDCNETPQQQWVFTRLGNDLYTIKNVGNGKYVAVALEEVDSDSGKIEQRDQDDKSPLGNRDQFKVVPRDGGVHITSAANGKIVWVDSSGKLRHWKNDAGQTWNLDKVVQEPIKIVPEVPYTIKEIGVSKCWTVPDSSTENGLVEAPCNKSRAQQWEFVKVTNGVYVIKNVENGKYIEVVPDDTTNSGKIQQSEPKDPLQEQQKFKIETREGQSYIVSVANGRSVWVDTDGALGYWKNDDGEGWKLVKL